MKPKNEDLVVVIDIGSSKIITVISEVDEKGNITVIGIGKSSNNEGVRDGAVVNINSVVESINESIRTAEIQAGREVRSVYLGVSGKDVQSFNQKGVVAISGSNKEINTHDLDRVIDAAKAIAMGGDLEMLHIIPQWFSVDGQDNIRYPVGMVGTRLEAQVHNYVSQTSLQNVNRCFDRII